MLKTILASRTKSVLSALLTASILSVISAAESPTWRAGVATTTITPERFLWMAGYGARTRPADGRETDLHAKALALEDSRGTRLVIVTADLIGISRGLRKSVEERCAAELKLPPEALLLNASHTHSGPEYRFTRAGVSPGEQRLRPETEAYFRELTDKYFAVVRDALGRLEPAKLGYSHARAGFAMNRRLPTSHGFQNSPNPDGPVDQDVPVLRVTGADGKLRAVLFGYACHNTTLALYQWNADYAGYAQEFLQTAHPGVTAMFMLGCAGDQNPYPRGTVALAQQHGRALANGVEVALAVAPHPVSGQLRTALAEIDLNYSPAPTREELQTRAGSKDAIEAARAQAFLARLDAGEKLPTAYPYPIQIVRLGDTVLLTALGGEACVDYSLRLKRELAGRAAVWVAGYSNDVMAYIPSRRVRLEGGYEPIESLRASLVHPAPWADTLEERIVAKVHELVDRTQ